MHRSAKRVWQRLPDDLKQQVAGELTTLFTEVLHECIRSRAGQPSRAPRPRLRPPVQPAPSPHESRELKTPARRTKGSGAPRGQVNPCAARGPRHPVNLIDQPPISDFVGLLYPGVAGVG